MERRALLNGWRIPDELVGPILARQLSIAADAESDRDATLAFAALVKSQALHLAREKFDHDTTPGADSLSLVDLAREALDRDAAHEPALRPLPALDPGRGAGGPGAPPGGVPG